MNITNRNRNMIIPYGDVVSFYDVNIRFTFVAYGKWSILDLEAKVLEDKEDPLDHFSGHVESLYLKVYGMGYICWLCFG